MHALRGLNLLRLGSVVAAQTAFDRALRLEPQHPEARAGRAWCDYLQGDVTEALILLANLDEGRRDEPDDDPWRVWSKEQIERIQGHVEKVEWRDNFNRKRLMNQWFTREGNGPLVSMADGAAQIQGVVEREGVTQVYREYPAGDFVSFTANVWISSDTNVDVGLFVSRERQNRSGRNVLAEGEPRAAQGRLAAGAAGPPGTARGHHRHAAVAADGTVGAAVDREDRRRLAIGRDGRARRDPAGRERRRSPRWARRPLRSWSACSPTASRAARSR